MPWGEPRRILLAAFGDPGHAFPVFSLAECLLSRGHTVCVETADRWKTEVDQLGADFLPAPEYPLIPTRDRPLKPYEAALRAVNDSHDAIREFRPDVVVHDVLTIAPALIAELNGIQRATLIPHVHPDTHSPLPPYGFGARPARTIAGRSMQRVLEYPVKTGRSLGRSEYDDLRGRLGLPPLGRGEGPHSKELVLVATFPQLEYRRDWPPHIQVTGPLFWEPDFHDVALPAGDAPLILVAPSTAQDPAHKLLLASLKALGSSDVRVIATWNRREIPGGPPHLPANVNLVEWLSYSRTMPLCDAVVSHGGHGTLARTLQAAAIPIIVPAAGDQLENAARVDAARLGVTLPMRLLSPSTMALAVERALRSALYRREVSSVAKWSLGHSGPQRASDLIEELIDSRRPA